MAQSIQASAPARRGAPVAGAGVQSSPANLSTPPAPLTAKLRQRASWSAARTLTQNAPARAIRGQEAELRATLKLTSGGSSDSEEKD